LVKRFSNILATGGAGFIGSHLVDRLLDEGYEVTILDNLNSGSLENIAHNKRRKKLKLVKGDIRDLPTVKKALEDVDAVFHEAAFVSITLSVRDPILANDVNVSGTLNLLKASADLGVKRFVFASSAAVYGETPTPLKREDMITAPSSPYGVSKLAAESYVRSFYRTYGLETVSLRYFNVYGPRQSFDINCAYGGVITIFLNRLLRDMPPIIYGDGEQTRDFVYVQDIVEANMSALNTKDAAGEFLNIGSATRISVNRVAEQLKHLLNKKKIRNMYEDPRVGDVRHGCADISKAKKILGYAPRFSFEEGLAKLVEWYRREKAPQAAGQKRNLGKSLRN
jgi:nucleoside-diphosphate-sugar epimerase